jgi:hypothetical protein
MVEILIFLDSQVGSWYIFWAIVVGLILVAPSQSIFPDIDSRWFIDVDIED